MANAGTRPNSELRLCKHLESGITSSYPVFHLFCFERESNLVGPSWGKVQFQPGFQDKRVVSILRAEEAREDLYLAGMFCDRKGIFYFDRKAFFKVEMFGGFNPRRLKAGQEYERNCYHS
jgi:hypothetical protein